MAREVSGSYASPVTMGDTTTAATRTNGQPTRTLLPRLTALRLFAALAVFVYHLNKHGVVRVPGYGEVGYTGVAFFFVLSGFVLTWGTQPGLPARTFWRRRFARIYPSHLVMLVVAAVVPAAIGARSWSVAVPNLLLVHAWSHDPLVTYGMNGPSWSLSCEAAFYAAFPLSVWLLRRMSPAARVAVAVVALACEVAAIHAAPDWSYSLPVARFPEFLLGVVAGLALLDGWRPRVPLWLPIVLVCGATVAAASVPFDYPDVIFAPAYLAVIVWAAGRDLASKPGWLTSRAMIFAGEASFAFYLVQELVMLNLQRHLTGDGAVDAALIFAASCIAAVLLHMVVERPCNRLIRGRSRSVALA